MGQLIGRDSILYLGFEGFLAALRGDVEKAKESIAWLEQNSGEGTTMSGLIGFIYYSLGDLDKFFEFMDRAVEIHALPAEGLLYSPMFENARKDPRFEKLFAKMGLKVPTIRRTF